MQLSLTFEANAENLDEHFLCGTFWFEGGIKMSYNPGNIYFDEIEDIF